MKKIISVEGNIASGKSTFLNIIKKYNPDFNIIPEPIYEWQNIIDMFGNPYNLFGLAAKEPSRFSFPFQLATLNSHIKMLNSAKKFEVFLLLNGVIYLIAKFFQNNITEMVL